MIDISKPFVASVAVMYDGSVLTAFKPSHYNRHAANLIIAEDRNWLEVVKDRFFTLKRGTPITQAEADARVAYHELIALGKRSDIDVMQRDLDAIHEHERLHFKYNKAADIVLGQVASSMEKIHTCSCGWETPYPIVVSGTYVCQQCKARKKAYG